MFWIGFAVGMVVGACFGVTLYALMAISKNADIQMEKEAACLKTPKA